MFELLDWYGLLSFIILQLQGFAHVCPGSLMFFLVRGCTFALRDSRTGLDF